MNYAVGDKVMWHRDGEQACVLSGRVIALVGAELIVSGEDGLVYWVSQSWTTTTP